MFWDFVASDSVPDNSDNEFFEALAMLAAAWTGTCPIRSHRAASAIPVGRFYLTVHPSYPTAQTDCRRFARRVRDATDVSRKR
jgi:hypothetical protein